jgi:GDP-mannose 6-dehydrogenase
MRISIFGLGYVGTVTSACLARDGHDVIGVDINESKVGLLAAGRSPIVEPGLAELLADAASRNTIRATTDAAAAVSASDVSLVSVGTPARENGAPDLTYVFAVCRQIGEALRSKAGPHVIVLRSTVPPGTTEHCRGIIDAASGDAPFSLAFNPEFLREGSAVFDYDEPPYTVIGTTEATAERCLREMYAAVQARVFVVEPALAELIKYVANAWHATKIVFANEVGRLAKEYGVDGRQVMAMMVEDKKLNISKAYLRPGFAYGGSCLPKDVKALVALARERSIDLPLLSSLQVSNSQQIEAAVTSVLSHRPRKVAVLGLAFKPSTDDLRESPAVALVKRLIGEGCQVRIYAPDVNEARLMGTNLAYIRENLPHFEALMVDQLDGLIPWSDVTVITQAGPEFVPALSSTAGIIVDLAGAWEGSANPPGYQGIAW